MSPLRRAALAALAVVAVGGCQMAGVRDDGVRLDPSDGRVRSLLSTLVDPRDRPTALRAAAQLRVDAGGLKISRPQRIVAQRPASLRVEVIGLFGQVAGVVATDGRRFGFVDLLSGRREQGRVDDELLWRTARVDLTPSEAVDLILGSPRVGSDASVVSARVFGDGAIGLRVRGRDRSRERWVEFDALGRLRRIELRDEQGTVMWSARYADWRAVDGMLFAYELDLAFPRVEGAAAIRFDAVALDPEIPPELFVLQVPAGSAADR